jgi:hypothetical protein
LATIRTVRDAILALARRALTLSQASSVRSLPPEASTAELTPARAGMGAICNFGSEATHFSELFPGITPHLLTLASNFQVPVFRDVLLSLGMCSVASSSCANILRKGASRYLEIPRQLRMFVAQAPARPSPSSLAAPPNRSRPGLAPPS